MASGSANVPKSILTTFLKTFEQYWSTIKRKGHLCVHASCIPKRLRLRPHSSAYIAIQDVAMVQQCLQPENLTKQVKLKTKSALAFPMLNEGFGEHFLCNLTMLPCFLEPSLLVKVELQNITLVQKASSVLGKAILPTSLYGQAGHVLKSGDVASMNSGSWGLLRNALQEFPTSHVAWSRQ